jgi:hypothetical protein
VGRGSGVGEESTDSNRQAEQQQHGSQAAEALELSVTSAPACVRGAAGHSLVARRARRVRASRTEGLAAMVTGRKWACREGGRAWL